nr:protein nrt1/ ptr family 2.4 [Quercus suber]
MRKRPCEASAMEMGEGESIKMGEGESGYGFLQLEELNLFGENVIELDVLELHYFPSLSLFVFHLLLTSINTDVSWVVQLRGSERLHTWRRGMDIEHLNQNLIVYLIQVFNLKNINAAQISNIVSGSTNLLPVIGAIVADSFFGTFFVAAVSAYISLLDLITNIDIYFQNPPELDAPLFGTTEAEKEAKIVNPELEDL